MKVRNEIYIHSINEKDTVIGEITKLQLSNVWNSRGLVELQIIPDGMKITVRAEELIKAVRNATDNDD